MKVYEKMGIDLTTQEGVESLFGISCEDIPDKIGTNPKCPFLQEDCDRCRAERLFAEVPTKKVPRVAMINTVKELEQAREDYEDFCNKQGGCNNCVYGNKSKSCFDMWLSEEIEVAIIE